MWWGFVTFIQIIILKVTCNNQNWIIKSPIYLHLSAVKPHLRFLVGAVNLRWLLKFDIKEEETLNWGISKVDSSVCSFVKVPVQLLCWDKCCYLCCRGLEKVQRVLLTHGDSIEKIADNFRVVAASGSFPSSIANDKLRLYGVQFHPEVGVFVLLSTVSVGHYSSSFLHKATNLLSSDMDVFHHVVQ
jgi:hypothetical protein